MAADFESFTTDLKKKDFSPVYIFSGVDPYLKRKAVERLAEALFPAGEGSVTRWEAPDGIREAVDEARSSFLFSPLRLLVISRADRVVEDHRKLLEPVLPRSVSDFSWAFVCGEGRKQPPRWLRERSVEIVCTSTSEQLRRWIEEFLKRRGLRVEGRALSCLVERSGGVFGDIVSDLEKIALFLEPGETVSPDVVGRFSLDRSEENVFVLVDAVLAGRDSDAVSAAEGLIGQGASLEYILAMCARSVKVRWAAAQVSKQVSHEEVSSRLRISKPWVARIRSRGESLDPERAKRLWDILEDSDARLKTGSHDERQMRMILLGMVRAMCGTASRPA